MITDPHRQPVTNSRETLYAILISALISVLLATLVVGNPFHAFGAAYGDYTGESTAGLKPADTVRAPSGENTKPAPSGDTKPAAPAQQ